MAKLNFSNAPFWDDFDEKKNYLRILFRPARAVQARELTQLQTSLQNQVKKFGDHILQDGTPIVDAKIKVDFDKPVFKLNATDSSNNPVVMSKFLGKTIVGATSSATGIIVHVDETTRAVFVDYRGGKFTDGERIDVSYVGQTQGEVLNATITTGSLKTGVYANQETGVYYVSGHFVYCDKQGIIVDDSGNKGNYKIGFEFSESIATADQDSSLFDNAVGTPNQTAPGADRYKGVIKLKVYKATVGQPLSSIVVSDDFYEVVVVRDGEIIKENNTVQYSDIMDTMARRTYDESGNYTVRDFPIQVKEYETTEQTEQATKGDYLTLGLEAGKGYVHGYEVETKATAYLKIPRARTFETVNNEYLYPDFGPWLETKSSNGRLVDFSQRKEVNLKSGSKILNPNHKVTVVALTNNTNSSTKRVYLSGVGSLMSVLPSVTRIEQKDDTTKYIEVDPSKGINATNAVSPVFPLKESTIKEITLNETSYDVVRYMTLQRSGATFNIVADSTSIDFPPNNQAVIFANLAGGRQLTHGTDYSYTVDNSSSPSRLTITLLGSASTQSNIDVAIRMTKRQANPRTKTLTTFVAQFSDPVAGVKKLSHTDIYRIVSVKKGGQPVTGTELEVIKLDNGQRDYYYDYGILSGLQSNSTYEVIYQYFEHGSQGDFFAVNSYTTTTNLNLDKDIYTTIPSYVTQDGSGIYFLSDCLDFRRSVTQLSGGSNDIVHPETSIRTDYTYYVGRKDKVYIDKNGVFGVKQGIPAKNPEDPLDVDESMLLYNLTLPPYTFYPNDIGVDHVSNKRYTMKDIGKLEQRIDNLEYFTSLSLLEQDTNNLTITDVNGKDKFKNGMLVDNFTGHGIGDVSRADYRIAIDRENGVIRTPFVMQSFDLEVPATGSTNIIKHDHIATLSYTNDLWLDQTLASEHMNVNPYAVFQWVGDMTLTPSSDNWMDTRTKPDVTVNFEGANDNLKKSVDAMKDLGVIGTNWNAWQNTWSGSKVLTGQYTNTSIGPWQTTGTTVKRSSSSSERNVWTGNQWWNRNRSITTTTTKTTTSTAQSRKVTNRTTNYYNQSIGQRRSGTTLQVIPGKITKSMGDRVVDTSIIPWMRSRNVRFNAHGLKPNTVLKATFDSVDVTSHCKMAHTGAALGTLKTNVHGSISGWFTIPNNTNLRFRTGVRLFRLHDDDTQPETSAEAKYEATGMMQTKQKTIMSVDNPQLVQQSVSENRIVNNRSWSTNITQTQQNRTLTNVSTRTSSRTTWKDPLAQSFLITVDSGLFLTGIDLYFKTKDPTIPVTVYIVENDNGYPSQNKVPYSEVTLNPNQVNISSNGSSRTHFAFSDPVYLTGATEYSFVVMSNSNKYEAYVAKIGDINLITNKRITKQPYTGSLFKSQNSSTWTADQDRDLKFRLHRAKFSKNDGTLQQQNADFASFSQLGANYRMDMTTVMLNIDTLEFNGTSVEHKVKMRHGDYAGSYKVIENKNNIEMFQPAEIYQANGEGRPLLSQTVLNTINDYVSPVVSMTRNSIVGISNIVVGTQTEKDAGTYISRTVSLENPSDDLRVYLDVFEPDANTKVKVYFKTDKYIPRYVDTVNDVPTYIKGSNMQVLWYKNNGESESKGTFQVTNVIGKKLYIGQVTNVDSFRNASGNNSLPNDIDKVYAIASNDIVRNIRTFETGKEYVFGEYVISGGLIYKALDNVSNQDSANVPSASTLWLLIPHADITGEIKDGEEQEWRELVRSNNTPNTNFGFTEHMFIPQQALDNEFTSFSIKIQLLASNKAITPFAKNLRALALF